jgi:hypothetical protein
MTEESDRMMVLLQELAALKRGEGSHDRGTARKRRREISKEMKKLATQKTEAEGK